MSNLTTDDNQPAHTGLGQETPASVPEERRRGRRRSPNRRRHFDANDNDPHPVAEEGQHRWGRRGHRGHHHHPNPWFQYWADFHRHGGRSPPDENEAQPREHRQHWHDHPRADGHMPPFFMPFPFPGYPPFHGHGQFPPHGMPFPFPGPHAGGPHHGMPFPFGGPGFGPFGFPGMMPPHPHGHGGCGPFHGPGRHRRGQAEETQPKAHNEEPAGAAETADPPKKVMEPTSGEEKGWDLCPEGGKREDPGATADTSKKQHRGCGRPRSGSRRRGRKMWRRWCEAQAMAMGMPFVHAPARGGPRHKRHESNERNATPTANPPAKSANAFSNRSPSQSSTTSSTSSSSSTDSSTSSVGSAAEDRPAGRQGRRLHRPHHTFFGVPPQPRAPEGAGMPYPYGGYPFSATMPPPPSMVRPEVDGQFPPHGMPFPFPGPHAGGPHHGMPFPFGGPGFGPFGFPGMMPPHPHMWRDRQDRTGDRRR